MADNNTAVGVNSLTAVNSTGADNVAIGTNALAATTSGTQNVAVGSQAGKTNAAGNSSGNILIGYNVDVPSNPTSNYMNIGGAIKGDMSVGPITFNTAINFKAKTQTAGDNSTNLATTAYADAAAAGSSPLKKLYSGSVDTSSGTINVIDFGDVPSPPYTGTYPVPLDTYLELQLRITALTSNQLGSQLFLQFLNQGNAVNTQQYMSGALLNPTQPTSGPLNSGDGTYGGSVILHSNGDGDLTDGSGTIFLKGFSFSSTTVTPNAWIELLAQSTGGATPYFADSTGFVACNNVAAKIFDGLKFVADSGKFTFNWALYGIK